MFKNPPPPPPPHPPPPPPATFDAFRAVGGTIFFYDHKGRLLFFFAFNVIDLVDLLSSLADPSEAGSSFPLFPCPSPHKASVPHFTDSFSITGYAIILFFCGPDTVVFGVSTFFFWPFFFWTYSRHPFGYFHTTTAGRACFVPKRIA